MNFMLVHLYLCPRRPARRVFDNTMKRAGGILIPVMRQAALADFNNQGEVKIRIQPDGHDTWKLEHSLLRLALTMTAAPI